MGVWCFNKGEWTEVYVFLRLLGKGRIYGANKNLVKDESLYLDIKEILRYEGVNILAFKREIEGENSIVRVVDNDTTFKIITAPELDEHATILYREIIRVKGNNGTFSSEFSQQFLEGIGLKSPKANLPQDVKERYGKKSDIILRYTTSFDHAVNTNGFSIKSHVGSSATLFNSSAGSNLIYIVDGCNDDKMYRINSISSETGIFEQIKNDPDLSLSFNGVRSQNFEDNMILCESSMLQILNTLLLIQIGYIGNAEHNSSKDLVQELIKINPIKVRKPEQFYTTIIKRFLFNSFAGMTASESWDGRKLLTGGYIDVSKDGEILYYRAISDEVFESYLFEHTYWDRPSRGINKDVAQEKGKLYVNGFDPNNLDLKSILYDSKGNKKPKKGDWGYIYKENDEYYISINFQVRFK